MSRLTPCITSMRRTDTIRSDQLLHGHPQLLLGDLTADPRFARRSEQHEWRRAVRDALLVAPARAEDLLDVHTPALASGRVPAPERHGQVAGEQQLTSLRTQIVRAGEPQRGEQSQTDRLAVTVTRIARDSLDRMADGVSEVQRLAAARVALVCRDDGELGANTFENRAF